MCRELPPHVDEQDDDDAADRAHDSGHHGIRTLDEDQSGQSEQDGHRGACKHRRSLPAVTDVMIGDDSASYENQENGIGECGGEAHREEREHPPI